MKVSIITVCKNAEKTIATTIQAVLNQTYPDIEYIVIDGDSQDNTKQIIQSYRDRISIFSSEPDTGVYQAMNKGIAQASGDFLYFANADDYLFDHRVIQDLVQYAAQHSDCDLIYGHHEARYATGDRAIHQPATPEQMIEEMVSLGNCLIQPACFFRASLFTQVGGFNETYKIAADYEWFARLLQKPELKLCPYPRTIVSYSHGGLSSNIPALFAEVFTIQNQVSLYQQEPWFTKRIQKLQQSFIDKYDLLERTHKLSIARLRQIESLEARIKSTETPSRPPKVAQLQAELEALQSQNSSLKARIEAMETSKFWRLRTTWFQIKRRLGLPIDQE